MRTRTRAQGDEVSYELEDARDASGSRWLRAKNVSGVDGAPLVAPRRALFRRRRGDEAAAGAQNARALRDTEAK